MSESNDQNEQCFIPANWEESTPESTKQPQFPILNMKKLLSQAKQLHNITKPTSLVARTCFLQLPLARLPSALEEQTIEQQQAFNQTRQYKMVQNYNHFTFQEYFRDHQIMYNKMKMYGRPSFELLQPTSRFKPISHLADFHQKLFKQLYVIDNKTSPTHIAINDSFDSNFQNGNLGMVYKKQETMDREYFLLLQNDVNTHGYASWFFFKVKSCGKGRACFHILNFSKSLYLYKLGWKISIFSMSKYQQNGQRWIKGGKNIQVYNSNFDKRGKDGGSYYCLYFEYDFQEDENQVYFAMSKPYTYSMLANSIEKMQSTQNNDIKIQVIRSISSVSCNIIPIIVLSEKQQKQQNNTNEQYQQIQDIQFNKSKKTLVFMARQHPGQVVGSNLMEQTMSLFISNKIQVKQLLKLFTIVLIPMVNPDGVVHGNSRCNLAGLDLNRQWMKQSIKQVTPETYYLRKFLWELQQKIGIQYLIDLHGHSKKMNSFFFCNKTGDKFPSQYLPYLVSKIDKRFQLGSCTFNTTIDKKNTLRNQLFQSGMKNCITVQNSYFGCFQQRSSKLYKDSDFKQMAESIIKSLHFMLTEPPLQKNNLSLLYSFSKQQIANQIKTNKDLVLKRSGKCMNQDIQSQSDPEGDIMKPQQMIKIYEYTECMPRKKSEIVIKKKIKTKKTKQQKQKKQTIVTQINKDDQIRKSQPSKIFKQKPIQVKNHKSEKKLELAGQTKKSQTQQRFRQASPKPALILSRKYSEKRQRIIKKTVLSMNHPQNASPRQQQKQEDTQTQSPNNLLNNPSYYKYPSYQANLNKINSQQRRVQARIKTEVQEQATLKKNTLIRNQNYQKMREQRLKMFLNQTLSIMRVNNHQMVISKTNDNQLPGHKGSLKNDKLISKRVGSQRFLTQNPTIENSPIQTQNSHEQIIQKQRKKFLSRSYRKQLLKRKKILSVQQQVKHSQKYKKFQNFRQNEQKEEKKNIGNPFCSSVFYYFPVV